MALKIRWSPRAAANLEDTFEYIAKDSKHYASLFIIRLNNLIKSIPNFPQSGRMVPEYGTENLREKIFENYRIVYRLKEEWIEIVAIIHSAKPLSHEMDESL